MSRFGDDPTLSTLRLGGRLKISRGSIHAHVHGTAVEWEPWTFVVARVGLAWGPVGRSQEVVAPRPELLANHWLQLPRWTERQAPNVNIGVSIAGAVLCLEGPNFTTCHFFHFLWDLNCFTESLLLPSLGFLGSPSHFPIRARLSTQLSRFRSSLCLPSATSRQGPKHDLVRSSGSSLCHDACGALESWKARQP